MQQLIDLIKTEISTHINHAQLNGKPEIADAMRELKERIDSLTNQQPTAGR